MGVPREPVRLIRLRTATPDVRMVGIKSGDDWTVRMQRFAAGRVRALQAEELSGFVLKAKSPSCGMTRVKLYDGDKTDRAPEPVGAGLFAAALMERFPNLPVEEEGRLCDARLRENFIERLFAYARLRRLWQTRWTLGGADSVSHRAQDGAAGALDGGLPRARAAGRASASRWTAPSCASGTRRSSWRRWRGPRRPGGTPTSSCTCWGTSPTTWTRAIAMRSWRQSRRTAAASCLWSYHLL